MTIADRIEVESVTVLADDWSVLKKTVLRYRRRDGTWQRLSRETYDRGDGAVILLYDPARRTVVLTRQFRYPALVNGWDDLLIEAPAGLLDRISPEARIGLEAEEETGFRVRDVRRIFEAFMSPGSVTEKLFFFVARYEPVDRVGLGGGNAEEGEDIDVLELRIEDALGMIETGAIRDGKTILLLQYAALHLFPGEPATRCPSQSLIG
ncbi:NUDIX domain-containing protein [Lichenifustis flavocetrariae]|uniref:GDP-mannose pyrophosphatase n=1 Tax=Lichenifustis flavocetrariae TaxID=2949735 RepID=A0AA41YWK7_9HYPH|nr:NUDIX domain-containing protein [Lichenifustis flavocetrariae]MCW6508482.1 NUDIX domain-containing protein [Lichenifustis flavocetrariae]